MGFFDDLVDDETPIDEGLDMRRKKEVDVFDSDVEVEDLDVNSEVLHDPIGGSKKKGGFDFGF